MSPSELLAGYRKAHDEWFCAPPGPEKRQLLLEKYAWLDRLHAAGLDATGKEHVEKKNIDKHYWLGRGGGTAAGAGTATSNAPGKPARSNRKRTTAGTATDDSATQTKLF